MQAAEVNTSTPFPHLFRRFAIRGVRMVSRLVFQPHFTTLGSRDGMPTDDLRAYHEERAQGAVGLIIMESPPVHPPGKMSKRFMNTWDPAVIPGLARISRAVHSHGTMIFGQLTHGGHTSLENPPQVMWAPTQMPEPSSHHSTKAMDADDIRSVIDGFARSARHLIEVGLDGFEVKIAHNGLLRSFASPYFNRITDSCGGSFENRMRFSFEVDCGCGQGCADHRLQVARGSLSEAESIDRLPRHPRGACRGLRRAATDPEHDTEAFELKREL